MDNTAEIKTEVFVSQTQAPMPSRPVVADIFNANITGTSTLFIIKTQSLSYYVPFLFELQNLENCSNRRISLERMHIFIEIFDSFKTETNLALMRFALQICFKLSGTFSLTLVNELVDENIIQAFGIYLKKLQQQNQLDLKDILDMVSTRIDLSNIEQLIANPDKFYNYLCDIDVFQYTIICTFIKNVYPTVVLNFETINNVKYNKINDMSVITPDAIHRINSNYTIHSQDTTKVKLYLERAGVLVGRGTSVLTSIMFDILNRYISADSNWSIIYCDKILSKLIIPFIDMKMLNEECVADIDDLRKTLMHLKCATFRDPIIDRAFKNVLCFLEYFNDPLAVEHLARFVVLLRQHGCLVLQNQNMLFLHEPISNFVYFFKTDPAILIGAIQEILHKCF